MQPVTKRLLGGLLAIGVPVRRMQKIKPSGTPRGVDKQHNSPTKKNNWAECLQAHFLNESVSSKLRHTAQTIMWHFHTGRLKLSCFFDDFSTFIQE